MYLKIQWSNIGTLSTEYNAYVSHEVHTGASACCSSVSPTTRGWRWHVGSSGRPVVCTAKRSPNGMLPPPSWSGMTRRESPRWLTASCRRGVCRAAPTPVSCTRWSRSTASVRNSTAGSAARTAEPAFTTSGAAVRTGWATSSSGSMCIWCAC